MLANIVSLSTLFSQPVAILIVILLFLELLGWTISAGSLKKVANRIRRLAKVGRWDIASGLLWLVLLIITFLDLRNTSPVSLAFLGTGVTAFLVGWWIRYRHVWLTLMLKHIQKLRPWLSQIQTGFSFGNVRHPHRLGAWLEMLGMTVSAMSAVAFWPSLFLLPLVFSKALSLEEQRIEDKHGEWLRNRAFHALVPGKLDSLRIVSVPATIGFLIGVFNREFILFRGGVESARSLLTMLTQVEGTLGVLAITIIFVLTQLTAASFSTRTSAILLKRWAFWVPLLILLVSITYNILMISRLDILFQHGIIYGHFLVDLSLILGAVTTFGIAFFIWRAPRLISPEAIIDDALRPFDGKWVDVIRNDWRRPVIQLRLRVGQDPLVVVERILSKLVESGDSLSFASGLFILREHFQKVVKPGDMIEFDAYLHHHLRNVIRKAVDYSDSYSLEQLVAFIEELGAPSREAIFSARMSWLEDPPGEKVLREIIKRALNRQLVEPLLRALRVVTERSEMILRLLPSAEDTWMYNPDREQIHLSQLSEEEKERIRLNDDRIMAFKQQYLGYLGKITESAIEAGLKDIGWSASDYLTLIMLQIPEHAKGLSIKQILIIQGLNYLYSASKVACEKKLRRAVALTYLDNLVEKLDANTEENLALRLVGYVKDILIDQAKAGILDFEMVIEIAMLGLRIVEKFTEPAVNLIQTMGEAARYIKSQPDFSENKEHQYAYTELISRIRQQKVATNEENREKIRTAIKSVLEKLGEPEFDEK